MCKNNDIMIIAEKIDNSVRLLGVEEEYETKEYQIARVLQNKFAENNIITQIKDLKTHYTETEIHSLKIARILIIMVTEYNHLNIGKQIVERVQKEVDSKLEYVFFVTLENNIKNIQYIDIHCKNILSEFIRISKNYMIQDFVDTVCYYLSLNLSDKKLIIPKELKESYLIGQPFAKFAENIISREWLDKELETWMISSKLQRFFWLCGEHGSGKTVFIGNYFEQLTNVGCI